MLVTLLEEVNELQAKEADSGLTTGVEPLLHRSQLSIITTTAGMRCMGNRKQESVGSNLKIKIRLCSIQVRDLHDIVTLKEDCGRYMLQLIFSHNVKHCF